MISRSVVAMSVLLSAFSLWFVGCETTSLTTMEENSALYRDAREFLQNGTTTKADAKEKYGQPQMVRKHGKGEMWRFRRTDTVVMNAHTGTPLGTDGSLISRQGSGDQHKVIRKMQLDLYFDQNGMLVDHNIIRNAP